MKSVSKLSEMKELCISAPVQAHADFTKPLKLHIDACRLGIGLVCIKIRREQTR